VRRLRRLKRRAAALDGRLLDIKDKRPAGSPRAARRSARRPTPRCRSTSARAPRSCSPRRRHAAVDAHPATAHVTAATRGPHPSPTTTAAATGAPASLRRVRLVLTPSTPEIASMHPYAPPPAPPAARPRPSRALRGTAHGQRHRRRSCWRVRGANPAAGTVADRHRRRRQPPDGHAVRLQRSPRHRQRRPEVLAARRPRPTQLADDNAEQERRRAGPAAQPRQPPLNRRRDRHGRDAERLCPRVDDAPQPRHRPQGPLRCPGRPRLSPALWRHLLPGCHQHLAALQPPRARPCPQQRHAVTAPITAGAPTASTARSAAASPPSPPVAC